MKNDRYVRNWLSIRPISRKIIVTYEKHSHKTISVKNNCDLSFFAAAFDILLIYILNYIFADSIIRNLIGSERRTTRVRTRRWSKHVLGCGRAWI